MPNEAFEAIEFTRTTAAQPMIRTCRKLTVGHSLTPDEVDGGCVDHHRSDEWDGMSTTKVVDQNDGDVITFVLDPDGVFSRADFPHPMVTVDRDVAGNVISVSAVGRFTQAALEIYAKWRQSKASPEALVFQLAKIESTVQPQDDGS